uniref:Uncharacterized protein n=1 Tax=Coccidioides posadasii RMSCC 3488 TaxID=454284 RepID=A0A0J6FEK8_COCPO|nr:hypothetical protein CPAG_05078 [Coccidioides posadasii RMSCC 3488]
MKALGSEEDGEGMENGSWMMFGLTRAIPDEDPIAGVAADSLTGARRTCFFSSRHQLHARCRLLRQKAVLSRSPRPGGTSNGSTSKALLQTEWPPAKWMLDSSENLISLRLTRPVSVSHRSFATSNNCPIGTLQALRVSEAEQ